MSNKTALGNMLDKVAEIPTLTIDSETILSVDPLEVYNWEFHDRPMGELGDIEALAKDMATIGQQQPCVVRFNKSSKGNYELIVGERRWRAALKAKIKLKIIVRKLSDVDAALAQAAENDNREDLSEYAKGISFSKLIDGGVIKQKDLIVKLGKSKQYVSSLLSFSKLPPELISSIGDMSKVSSKTAEKIKQLLKKDPKHLELILPLSDKIREGKIGWEKLERVVLQEKENVKPEAKSEKFFSNDGRHILTLKLNGKEECSALLFSKDIKKVFKENNVSFERVIKRFKEVVEDELKSS